MRNLHQQQQQKHQQQQIQQKQRYQYNGYTEFSKGWLYTNFVVLL